MKNTNILGVESNVYDCGFCKKESATLTVPWAIYAQWLMLMHEGGKNEWGAVFQVKDNVVVDWGIPKQTVTGSSCLFHEELGGNGLVHSHHDLGAFHSGQDDKQARNLYEWSIVLSHISYVATKKHPLPCGGIAYIDVEVVIDGHPLPDAFELIKEKEKEKTVYSPKGNVYEVDQGKMDFDRDKFLRGEEGNFPDEDDKEYYLDTPLACRDCKNDYECHTCEHLDPTQRAMMFGSYYGGY